MKGSLETILVALAAAVLLIVTGVAVCALFGWLNIGPLAIVGSILARWTGFGSAESARRAADQRTARLRSPQYAVLEAHFGAPVPESLKRLYRNVDLLAQEDFRLIDPDGSDPEDGDMISEFLPADKTALDEIVWDFGEPLFPFASDGFGNYYCVLMRGGAPGPCPVYFWFHEDPGSLEEMKIPDSLDEFLARPRDTRPGGDA